MQLKVHMMVSGACGDDRRVYVEVHRKDAQIHLLHNLHIGDLLVIPMVASVTLKPPAFLLIIFVTITLIIWNREYIPLSYFKMSSQPEWSSKYEGWYSRSTPQDDSTSSSTFTPTREALAFAVLHSAQADADGFTLALFHPNIAVDAMGRLLVVEKDDFTGLTTLAQKTPGLPQTGSFWNTWRVSQERSEQVIRRLLVATSKEGELVETSVQGYSKEQRALAFDLRL